MVNLVKTSKIVGKKQVVSFHLLPMCFSQNLNFAQIQNMPSLEIVCKLFVHFQELSTF